MQGDFGISYVFGQSALQLIVERMPATFELVLVSVIISILVAIPLGVFAGAYPNKKSSKTIMLGSLMGISLPNFWVGMMLIFIFAVHFRVMPSSGRGDVVNFLGMRISIFTPDGFRHIILPAIMLSVQSMAILLRLTRAGMMEVMKQDFIKFARSKGALQKTILFRHALKNAIIPVITVFGIQIGRIIAFATVTETIFSWPGMGKLLIDSINRSDRPVMVAYLMIVSFIFVLLNFIVDVLYSSIDPRIDLR
jgi:peptide/nickel transport system permease protein